MEAASVRQQAPDAGLNISTETVAAAVPVEAAAERAAVPPPSRPKPEAPQPFETQRLGRHASGGRRAVYGKGCQTDGAFRRKAAY